MNATLPALLYGLVLALPLMGVSIAAIVLSRRRLRAFHPRASRFATLGFLSLLGYEAINLAIRIYAASDAVQEIGPRAFAQHLVVANIFGYALLLAAVVLILLAILAERRPVAPSASGVALPTSRPVSQG